MCGIFGLITKQSIAPKITFAGLSSIEYRGYDSWGIAYLNSDSFHIEKQVGFLPKKLTFPDSQISLGHTRWATHGGVTRENAHPHADCQGKIVLVHNGIVENYLDLKSKLKHHSFRSETDSEVIVHLIENKYSKLKNLKQSVALAFNKLKGLNALVVSDGQTIVAVKVGSPLVVGKLSDGFSIASDPNALLPLTHDLLFLEDNQLVEFSDKLELFDVKKLDKLTPKFTKVDWDYASASLSNYKHFMLKEIFEQPKILLSLSQNPDKVAEVTKLIKKSYGAFFIGCGSAAYACLAGTYLFSKFAKRHINFTIGSEFNYIQDFLTPKSLLLAVSQSGETMDVVEPVNLAKQRKARVVAITNTLGSTLYRMADYPLMLEAGTEKAVCATKTFISMVANILLLTFSVAGDPKEGQKILKLSAKEVEKVIAKKSQIQKLASKIYQSKHIYILGRGLSYPVALESALKIKEISYIHAEGFASGELKHGVIALIEKGTPVMVFVPNDETKEAVLANAMEVKARGAYVIGVGVENNPVFDSFFEVKDCGASSMIPHVVFSQLLAYYLSVKLKLNPDKPRNLAKSVVVR